MGYLISPSTYCAYYTTRLLHVCSQDLLALLTFTYRLAPSEHIACNGTSFFIVRLLLIVSYPLRFCLPFRHFSFPSIYVRLIVAYSVASIISIFWLERREGYERHADLNIDWRYFCLPSLCRCQRPCGKDVAEECKCLIAPVTLTVDWPFPVAISLIDCLF